MMSKPHIDWLKSTDVSGNSFLSDIKSKIDGGLSPKQEAAIKAAYEREQKKRPAPEGEEIEFRGIVRSKKPAKYGDGSAAVIETNEGWSVWAVLPKGVSSTRVGGEVCLVADIKQSDNDPSFAFAKHAREA